jgi:GT2 family glycosyltransferase
MLDVSVLVVNHNARPYLRNCLSSLYNRQSAHSWETLVIDNASSDGSVEMVSTLFPEVKVLANSSNLGFARACNQGAAASRGRYLLLLNPDTVLLSSVDGLVEFMDSNPKCGVVGGRVLNVDGTSQPTCRSFPSLSLLPFGRESPLTRLLPGNPWSRTFLCTEMGYKEAHMVDAVAGVFMMLRKQLYDQIDGFDEDYFLFVEDIDLCYRARKAGWEICYVPHASIIHFGGRSTRSAKTRAMYQHYRGIHKFFLKHRRLRWFESGVLLAELFLGFWIYLGCTFLRQLCHWQVVGEKRSRSPRKTAQA